jgi:hypothetical protein
MWHGTLPERVLTGEHLADPERQERAHRIVAVQVEVEHRLVGGRLEPGEAAAVLHQAVRNPDPARGVVELHVARERWLT